MTVQQQDPFWHDFQALVSLLFMSLFSAKNFLVLAISAQIAFAASPPPNSGPGWAVLDEKTLYVQGGPFASMFALDLTQNFTDTNPPWTTLATGPQPNCPPTLVLTSNKTKLVFFDCYPHDTTIYTYDIATDQWQTGINANAKTLSIYVPPVTDPEANMVYGANGYGFYDDFNLTMMVFNATAGTTSFIKTPSIPSTLESAATTWSTFRKSMLVYGGMLNKSTTNAVSTFYEYVPATNKLTNVVATGTDPGKISSACMVPAYNGTKIVVFGGDDSANKAQGQICILDLTTMIWLRGNPTPSVKSRMACAAAGDNFLAWGGSNNITPIIYNMKMNQWVHEFIIIPPPNVSTSSTGVSSSTPTSTGSNALPSNTAVSSHGSNIGAIGGGVAAVVVVAAIGVFIFFRRKRSRQQVLKVDKPSRNETSRDSPLSDGDYQFNAMRSPSSAPQPTLSSKSFHIDRSLEADAKTGYSYYSRPRPPRPQESFPSQFSYGRNGPQSGVLSSQPSQNDIGYVSDPIGRNPQGIPYQQPDGAFQYYAGPQPHSVAAPHTSARVIAGGYRASQLGAPRVLPRHSQQSSQLRSTPSTRAGLYEEAMDPAMDPDLAKRQMELMQVQHALNLERLRIEQELKRQTVEDWI